MRMVKITSYSPSMNISVDEEGVKWFTECNACGMLRTINLQRELVTAIDRYTDKPIYRLMEKYYVTVECHLEGNYVSLIFKMICNDLVDEFIVSDRHGNWFYDEMKLKLIGTAHQFQRN